MRYIDEKRLRLGYLAIFALGIGLAVGSYWDTVYNEQAYALYFIAGMVGLLLLGLSFYLATEMILKDAVQVLPLGAPVAVADAPSGHADRAPVPPSAEIHIRTATEVLTAEVPEVLTAATEAAAALLEFTEEPDAIPGPSVVPTRVSGESEELPLELGDPFAAAARPTAKDKKRGRHGITSATRVLCGSCGLYFTVHVDDGRPQDVHCAKCESRLLISGHQRVEAHVTIRCRTCGDALAFPKTRQVSAVQCASCGQISELTKVESPGAPFVT